MRTFSVYTGKSMRSDIFNNKGGSHEWSINPQ